jgi:hypothetical protein
VQIGYRPKKSQTYLQLLCVECRSIRTVWRIGRDARTCQEIRYPRAERSIETCIVSFLLYLVLVFFIIMFI